MKEIKIRKIILDLEDAVAENQKDAARVSLYHALKSIDYGDTEVIVRINGLDTPHWEEDVRVVVAGGDFRKSMHVQIQRGGIRRSWPCGCHDRRSHQVQLKVSLAA